MHEKLVASAMTGVTLCIVFSFLFLWCSACHAAIIFQIVRMNLFQDCRWLMIQTRTNSWYFNECPEITISEMFR